MKQTPKVPSYDHLARLLDSIDLEMGPSELHGEISGLLCAGNPATHAGWFAEVFADRSMDDLLVREARQLVGQLYEATLEQMREDGFEYLLFIPDDSHSLQERAQCLTEWSQGFLYGLGLAGVDARRLGEDAREAIADITEITRLDYESVEADEDMELAYVELQEFLRVATLLIWEALSAIREVNNDTE